MGLFKFLLDDIKGDIRTLKKIGSGEVKSEVVISNFKKAFKLFPLILKTFWIFYVLIVLAFTIGWSLSAQHYNNVCQEIIAEEILPQVNNYNQLNSPLLGFPPVGIGIE